MQLPMRVFGKVVVVLCIGAGVRPKGNSPAHRVAALISAETYR